VLVKYSLEQPQLADGDQARRSSSSRASARDADRVLRLHPAVGVVCPGCGSRVGKPCVSTVRTLGIGAVGVPIEGVHVERIAAAREAGVA
jgi:hypothetical protein